MGCSGSKETAVEVEGKASRSIEQQLNEGGASPAEDSGPGAEKAELEPIRDEKVSSRAIQSAIFRWPYAVFNMPAGSLR